MFFDELTVLGGLATINDYRLLAVLSFSKFSKIEEHTSELQSLAV
jgi:hypothetical protein